MIFKRLHHFHGIDENLASERLHRFKQQFGVSGDTEMVFDYTGGVFHPVSGEYLGSLTEGGARSKS